MSGLERAVKSKRISQQRIDDSVRRILLAKYKLGLDKSRLTDIERLDKSFGKPEFLAQAQTVADRGVTLLRNTNQTVPLDASKPMRVLLVSLSADADPYPGETIEPEIRWRVDSLKAMRADMQFVNVSSLKLPAPDTYDVAIAALFVSLLSIFLTSLNLWMQRTHNRKTVLPIGHITVGDYEDDIFVRLRNDGVGPLIVDELSVFKTDDKANSKNAIIDFMPDLPGDLLWTTFVRDIKGRALLPQGHISLIEFKRQPPNKDFESMKEIVRRELSTLCVAVMCRNIYDDKMPLIVRRLDWFGRTE